MRTEAVGNCGCRLERTENGLKMVDCPLHAAAPDLLEAMKMVVASVPFASYRGDGELEEVERAVYSAIARAEGRE